MTIRRFALLAVQIAVLVLVVVYGGARYFTQMPGTPHEGPLPPLTAEEKDLIPSLRQHVEALAAHERNISHYEGLEKAARHIEDTLQSHGYVIGRQAYTVNGKSVRNIDAVIEPAPGVSNPEVLVIGAHYDSAIGTPGANNNATGTAALLELSRLLANLKGQINKRIRLVFFVNEEPPYFQTENMGSVRYVRALAEQKERVVAMYSLETLGYYSSEPRSQKYPMLLDLVLPDRGDFVAFFGLFGSRALVRRSVEAFRTRQAFPSVGGVGPSIIPGITWSDHWAFAKKRIPAVMITGTAHFRYPHYRQLTDTPEKIDFGKLARVTKGIEAVVRDAVGPR